MRQRTYNPRSYQRAKAAETPEKRAARLAKLKQYHAEKKLDPEYAARRKARFAAYRAANRQRIRSNQNAKNARNIARAHRRPSAAIAEMSAAGIHHITTDQLVHDRTRWRGPGWLRELELQEAADQILDQASQKKRGPTDRPRERQNTPGAVRDLEKLLPNP